MSRATVARLSSLVAELRAKRTAAASVPIAAETLRSAGFRVHCTWESGATWKGGLSVDAAPGLSEALADLEARGVKPGLVAIIRKIEDEP